MVKKKSRQSRVSSGKMASIHKAQEEKRQAKFAKRKKDGKVYEYKPNPYKPSKECISYDVEKKVRWHKQNDGKLPIARFTSLFRKLDNTITKEKEEINKKKQEGRMKGERKNV